MGLVLGKPAINFFQLSRRNICDSTIKRTSIILDHDNDLTFLPKYGVGVSLKGFAIIVASGLATTTLMHEVHGKLLSPQEHGVLVENCSITVIEKYGRYPAPLFSKVTALILPNEST